MNVRAGLTCLLGFVAPLLRANTPAAFDAWAEAFSAEWVRMSPAAATSLRYFSGAEQDALDRQLSTFGSGGEPYSRTAILQRAALARRGQAELQGFSHPELTAVQRTSAALLAWAFQNAIAAAEFPLHDPVFHQFWGLQIEVLNFLTQVHPIRHRRDIENYLARLALVAGVLDTGIADARAAAEVGLASPRFIVERTIAQLDEFLRSAPPENVFVTSLAERIDLLGAAIAPDERGALVAEATRITTTSVIPAYARVRALLVEQLPHTTDDAGVWRLPRGAAYYQQALAGHTTTALTADEIHAIGLREVARIEAEMDTLLRELGYNEGPVQARLDQLTVAVRLPAEPDPRLVMLAEYEKWLRDAERRAAALFDLVPLARVVVQREPPLTEPTAGAHYTMPAPDGSTPGIFWLPLPGPTFHLLTARTLVYHEAVPGHHFQLALQQESTALPRYRRLGVYGVVNAYAEGWGLYAERLADEEGWYAGDPRGRLGYLSAMLTRVRRLVLDTGLHARRWTRQQAMDYGASPQAVERYVVWPGQACSYLIGQRRIVEMREQARATLGGNFSLRRFHRVVLEAGNVPLDVLAPIIDDWIAAEQTAEATR